MSTTMDQLYELLRDQIQADPEYQKKRAALREASAAVLGELEALCGDRGITLLDAYGALTDQNQQLYHTMLFRSAVKLGMELGRMSA